MSIYVDDLCQYENRRGTWCHMVTDGPLEELHKFAAELGMMRKWFQDHARCPHYDICGNAIRKKALAAGAIAVSGVELFKKGKRK